MGLAICKQLLELMGGQIGVESRVGEGSRFWFTVRLLPGAGTVPPARAAADLPGRRICVVDDNQTNRLLLEHLLMSRGADVMSAEGGSSALRLLREAAEGNAPFDLAIVDGHMPEMDGWALARAIKADPALGAVKLVLLSSVGQAGAEAQTLEAGFSAYLTKPVRQSPLFDCLATVLGVPLADPEASAARQRSETLPSAARLPDPSGPVEAQDSNRPLVLVAEDNRVNQMIVVVTLEKLGYRADVVENGKQAVAAVQGKIYDTVLMDCQMPEMDGYEATREIRRWEATDGSGRHIPIVAMTANAMKGDRERCLSAGMDDYISKPARPEELERVLAEWASLRVRRVAAAAVSDHEGPGASGKPALDPQRLDELRRLSPGGQLLDQHIQQFLADLPGQVQALTVAVERGDSAALERAAHLIKVAGGNVGAGALSALCDSLEMLGRSGTVADAESRLRQVQSEVERVRAALESEQSRSS